MPITAIRTVPLIRSISAYATITGQVASTRLEWRRTGDITWRRGLPVALVGSELRGAVIGPPQWRSPTLPPPGLDSDTLYDVRVSVDFQDGSFDQAEIQTRTVPLEPPAPLRRFYVDPANGLDTNDGLSTSGAWQTIDRFMRYSSGQPVQGGAPIPGDAVVLFPGTYPNAWFETRYHPGTQQNPIQILPLDPQNRPVLLSGRNYFGTSAILHGFPGQGYWVMRGMEIREAVSQAVYQDTPGLWLLDNVLQKWSSRDSCVHVRNGGQDIIAGNTFRWAPGDPTPSGNPIFLAQNNSQGRLSILDNVFDLRGDQNPNRMDGIFTYPEDSPGGGWVTDGECHGNRFGYCPDDSFQVEGSARNVRAWGNWIEDCLRALGVAQPLDGPQYFLRNLVKVNPGFFSLAWNDRSNGFLKLGGAGMGGPLWIVNNTYWADGSVNGTGVYGDGPAVNTVIKNNLIVASQRVWYFPFTLAPSVEVDRNVYAIGRGVSGYWASVAGVTYPTMAAFAAATGRDLSSVDVPWEERQGLVQDPAGNDFTPQGAAVDRGEDIPGVTDDYRGAGPDVGAIESGLTASTFSLTTSVVGQGVVTVQPLGGQYLQGTPVTLTATPAAGWRFVEWQGDLTGSQNQAVLTMDGDKSVTAVFEQSPAIVTVSVQGSGTTDPAPGSREVAPGSTFTITAIPAENWQFAGWTVTGGYTSPDPTITVTVTADMTILATFVPVTFQVTIEVTPLEGGTTVPAPGTASYQQGQDITITAIQAGGYYFVEWRLNGQPLSPSPNPLPLTIQASGIVTAVFDRVVVPPATVSYSITALPGGTTEPVPGVYGPVPVNTVVQIEARPDAGKALDRWEYLGLTSRANPLVVQLPQDASIVAVFRDAPQPGVSIPTVIAVVVGGLSVVQILASLSRR